jgi:sigma-E factor negative regulatory protein RseA
MNDNSPNESQTTPTGATGLMESLSALMDGEAQPLELQRLLKQCEQDDELRSAWARYQMVSALVRKQSLDSTHVTLDFADRVQQALQHETPAHMPVQADVLHRVASQNMHQSQTNDSAPSTTRHWTKLAVAASVAFVMVAGVQWQRQSAVVDPALVATVTPSAINTPKASETNSPPVFLTSQPVGRNAQMQQVRFERYMQYHFEHASLNDGRGMLPLSNQVSHEER